MLCLVALWFCEFVQIWKYSVSDGDLEIDSVDDVRRGKLICNVQMVNAYTTVAQQIQLVLEFSQHPLTSRALKNNLMCLVSISWVWIVLKPLADYFKYFNANVDTWPRYPLRNVEWYRFANLWVDFQEEAIMRSANVMAEWMYERCMRNKTAFKSAERSPKSFNSVLLCAIMIWVASDLKNNGPKWPSLLF